jgi:hypothetical protein
MSSEQVKEAENLSLNHNSSTKSKSKEESSKVSMPKSTLAQKKKGGKATTLENNASISDFFGVTPKG